MASYTPPCNFTWICIVGDRQAENLADHGSGRHKSLYWTCCLHIPNHKVTICLLLNASLPPVPHPCNTAWHECTPQEPQAPRGPVQRERFASLHIQPTTRIAAAESPTLQGTTPGSTQEPSQALSWGFEKHVRAHVVRLSITLKGGC